MEFHFRETLEYLDDPEEDIHDTLKAQSDSYGENQYSYGAFLESDYWQAIREKAMAAACYKCVSCGATENLQVHHKKYFQRFTEHLNMRHLEVLCNSCHELSHE
jgi:hypothetical protein